MKRGEIYIVDLGPGAGYEVGGIRPVIVVSNDVYNVVALWVVVVPAVDAADRFARLGVVATGAEVGLPTDVSIIARQPRTLDASRFPEHPSGFVPDHLLKVLADKLKDELDLP